MKQALSITRKELDSYFSSPMALIFVGLFLVITLFFFFWIDGGFFARGVADVRPLFRVLPWLLVLLMAALTMRQWSEEAQTGTLEVLLTMPVSRFQLVLGKFMAVVILAIVALALTLFLPITVSIIGNLDWGPVIGGYLAALLMAASYAAIGLFVSSLTDNQIVALLITVIIGGLFYLIGIPAVTDLVGSNSVFAEVMRAVGTSSRFESIERGVIDLRDLLYYASLTTAFLGLNILSLDMKRWSSGEQLASYRRNSSLTTTLLALNLIALNVLAFPVNSLRLDLTASGEYSLSSATREILSNLQEPLLIRGYFSKDNHPLLDPLIPQVEDMLREYQVAAGGNLQVEIVDPIDDPELEREANQIYGIRPSPVQTQERSGVSVLNIYFDILIRYGDQNVTLTFSDLITVNQQDGSVQLRNLEYDLTSSIQRVVSGFQNIDAVLQALEEPARLTLYITPDTLPQGFEDAQATIESVANEIESEANGNFEFDVVDMSDPNAPITPNELYDRYQIQPIATSFFSPDAYYLHMVVETGGDAQVIYPSGALSETEIRTAIEAALKRAAPGFLQVVGVWTPPDVAQQDAFGQQIPSLSQYTTISQVLRESYEVRTVDLTTGQVPGDIDVLLVIAPQNMTEEETYALDQYLMRGGKIFVAAGNYKIGIDPSSGSLLVEPTIGNLQDLLAHYGITVEQELVLDPQNEPFPIPVQRDVGGVTVNEIQAVNYPHFVDVRPDGMNSDSPIVANLPAVTMNWVSPITIDEDATTDLTVTPLLSSTAGAWTTTRLATQPDETLYPQYGFPVDGDQGSRTLAVAAQGSFTSYYVDRPTPFDTGESGDAAASAEGDTATATPDPDATETPVDPLAAVGTLEHSPQSAELVVVGSAEFLNDNILQLSQNLSGDRFLNTLQLVQNTVDWFTQDTALGEIRAKGTTVRLLNPLTDDQRSMWENLNYIVAVAALLVIGVVWQVRKRSEQPMDLLPPGGQATVAAAATSEEGGR